MRPLPFIFAILAAALLYGIVVERDRLREFAGLPPAEVAPLEATAAADSGGSGAGADAPEPPDGPGSAAIRVIAQHSTAREIDSAVTLRGQTQPDREVDVMSETTGKVVSAPLPAGTEVADGDVLCELATGTRQTTLAEAEAALAEARASVPEVEARIPEAEARLAEAEAALEEARINANAAQELSGSGYASETRVAGTRAAVRAAEAAVSSAEAGLESARAGLQGSEARIRSAEAAVARARDEIEKLTLRAPFAGILESDSAELGALLQAGGMGGAPCATVISLDPIRVVGFVPETMVDRVHPGARATARLSDGDTVEGTVTFVSRRADEVTRTFRVEIEVPNPERRLSAGQTAEISIAADGALAHLLPQSALTLDDAGRLGVRTVADDGTALFRPADILRDTVEGVWLTGLPAQSDVIVVGQEYVTDGVPVAPVYEPVIQ